MTSAAWQRLYEHLARRFYAGVYNYLRWLCQEAELAEDLTQQTFVQIWRNPPELRGEKPLRAWVFRVARNEFLQHQRRAGLPTIALDDLAEDEESVSSFPNPQTELEREELHQSLRCALGRLPDAFRQVVVLRDVEGFSVNEIAEVLRVPAGTVKSRHSRAFALLRSMLAAEIGCRAGSPHALSNAEGSPAEDRTEK